MKNIFIRSVSGICLIITVLLSIYWSSITNFILFGLVMLIGQWEFYRLTRVKDLHLNRILGMILGISIYTLSYLIAASIIPSFFYTLLIPLFLVTLIAELYQKNPEPVNNISVTLLGALYLAIPLSTIHFLTLNSGFTFEQTGLKNHSEFISSFSDYKLKHYYAYFLLFGFFIIQWISDTGAFIFGITLGKHRLFQRISPKKSWEGAIGGLLTSVGVAFLIYRFYPFLDLIHWISISLIISTFGIYGDLFESLLKRSIEVKDSGKIFPGHGGILDRFDSSLMTLPMVYFYLQFISYV